MPTLHRLRRWAAACLIAVYLGSTLWFQGLHFVGDTGWHPLAYFWTWDMFPGYTTGSSRRVAIAETEQGDYLQVHPAALQQFRMGVENDMTRADYLPSVEVEPGRSFFRGEVAQNVRRTAPEQGRIVCVTLFEQYWPPRFNLTDAQYRAVYGDDNPCRKYWRIVGEADVSTDGTFTWNDEP